ncbi:MAG: hypothetical protein LC808_02110 [Actinobacteria bacterium]|nr:hypothetical protein [Actinomycetota bacterium]
MGKGARNRQRRAQSADQVSTESRDPAGWEHWLPEGPLRGDDPQTLALLARLATEHHMPCKLTYLHDPVLGCGAVPVAGITEDGTLIPDRSGTVDPIPVIMFEPSRSVISQDSRTGTAHDLLTETLITAGFHRISPGPIWSGRPAEGWGIYRATNGLVLRDPDGAVYAQGTTAFDPAWVSIATSLGSVLVLHGPCLGIRTPPGRTEACYTLADRAEEIKRGRRDGLLAGATVRWHPEPLEETLNWVLLPPGMFFQPLPVVYVPRWEFNRHGGPEACGLAPFRSFAETYQAHGMVAHITETDVDLYRPDVDRDLSFICGFHALEGTTDGRYAAWQQAALTARRLLLITGSREMPTGATVEAIGPQGSFDEAWNVLHESSVAIVTTTADHPAPLKS